MNMWKQRCFTMCGSKAVSRETALLLRKICLCKKLHPAFAILPYAYSRYLFHMKQFLKLSCGFLQMFHVKQSCALQFAFSSNGTISNGAIIHAKSVDFSRDGTNRREVCNFFGFSAKISIFVLTFSARLAIIEVRILFWKGRCTFG